MKTVAKLSALVALFAVPTACSQDPETASNRESSLGSAEQAIIRGESSSLADSRTSGVVRLYTGPARQAGYLNTCTGTLLNSRWVILASHCIEATEDTDGDGEIDDTSDSTYYQARIGNDASDTRSIAIERAVRHPSAMWGIYASHLDVALMRLAEDAPASALPAAYYDPRGRLPIYPGSAESLFGATVTEMGYGCNSMVVVNGVSTSHSGGGTLRQSRMPITWADSWSVSTESHDGSGLTCYGDSGGPMFLDDYGPARTRYLVGIHSTGTADIVDGSSNSTPSEVFRDWVEATVFGPAAAQLNCTDDGLTCVSAPAPLPHNLNFTTAFVPYGADQSRCYDVDVDYYMERNTTTFGSRASTSRGRATTRPTTAVRCPFRSGRIARYQVRGSRLPREIPWMDTSVRSIR